MDHDRLLKELLTTFFVDFLEVFCPELARYLDPGSVEFLDKEVFTDVTHGERHEVDLVARARFQGKPLGFLIHIEAQARRQEIFPKRMFIYFARFHEKYNLPVVSVIGFLYLRFVWDLGLGIWDFFRRVNIGHGAGGILAVADGSRAFVGRTALRGYSYYGAPRNS
jgi:hypothetical protein